MQMRSAGAARRIILPFYPAQVRGQDKAVTVAAKTGQQFRAAETGKGRVTKLISTTKPQGNTSFLH